MLGWLASLIGGPLIKGALDAYKARLEAGSTKEKLAAELAERELGLQQREAELASQVLIAEQGNWMTRWVRPLWALPFIIFTFKIVVWDKVLGLGSTDPIDPNMWSVYMLIAGAYFGGRSAEKIAAILKRK